MDAGDPAYMDVFTACLRTGHREPGRTDLESHLVGGHEDMFYTLALEPKNSKKPGGSKRLVWLEYKDGEVIRYTKEPKTTSWQRFKTGLIGLLPIESQL